MIGHPRLACWMLLQGDPKNCVAILAMVCSSFCTTNLGTSRRSPTTPYGDEEKCQHVRDGNRMLERPLAFVDQSGVC